MGGQRRHEGRLDEEDICTLVAKACVRTTAWEQRSEMKETHGSGAYVAGEEEVVDGCLKA